jgi:hypothetical protein
LLSYLEENRLIETTAGAVDISRALKRGILRIEMESDSRSQFTELAATGMGLVTLFTSDKMTSSLVLM